MPDLDQTIEAEVVEIDGVSVPPRSAEEAAPRGSGWQEWRVWQGKVKRLDPRWWPLWALLGVIALVLLVAVGMCVAVVLVMYRLFKAILLGFVSLLVPVGQVQRR